MDAGISRRCGHTEEKLRFFRGVRFYERNEMIGSSQNPRAQVVGTSRIPHFECKLRAAGLRPKYMDFSHRPPTNDGRKSKIYREFPQVRTEWVDAGRNLWKVPPNDTVIVFHSLASFTLIYVGAASKQFAVPLCLMLGPFLFLYFLLLLVNVTAVKGAGCARSASSSRTRLRASFARSAPHLIRVSHLTDTLFLLNRLRV